MNFLTPAVGELLVAHGQVVRVGQKLTICTADAFSVVEGEDKPVIKADKMVLTFYEKMLREHGEEMAADAALADPDAEIMSGLSEEQAVAEAARCLSCGECFDCGTCWSYCQDNAIVKPLIAGDPYKFKLEFCKGCDKCAEQCPCGYIEMYDPMTSSA